MKRRAMKRTCVNCHGWGYIRTGMPIFGMRWPCPDCHSLGYYRAEVSR